MLFYGASGKNYFTTASGTTQKEGMTVSVADDSGTKISNYS